MWASHPRPTLRARAGSAGPALLQIANLWRSGDGAVFGRGRQGRVEQARSASRGTWPTMAVPLPSQSSLLVPSPPFPLPQPVPPPPHTPPPRPSATHHPRSNNGRSPDPSTQIRPHPCTPIPIPATAWSLPLACGARDRRRRVIYLRRCPRPQSWVAPASVE